TPLVQLAGTQTLVVGCSWQSAPVAHRPVLPHTGPTVQRASAAPAATAAQVPFMPPVFKPLHAVQAPVQALVQQKPSTQNEDAHCMPVVQVWPAPARHCLLEQTWPAAHATPQAPQLAGSVLMLTQALLQTAVPAGVRRGPQVPVARPVLALVQPWHDRP